VPLWRNSPVALAYTGVRLVRNGLDLLARACMANLVRSLVALSKRTCLPFLSTIINRSVLVLAGHALTDPCRMKQSKFTSVPFQVLVLAIPIAESAPYIAQRVMSFRIFSLNSFLNRIA